jgi:hypothetical protein
LQVTHDPVTGALVGLPDEWRKVTRDVWCSVRAATEVNDTNPTTNAAAAASTTKIAAAAAAAIIVIPV